MTSPREAVSILTAAALVVAPVGGVAATYTTGYAEDGEALRCTAEEKAFPKTYEELVVRINGGELFSLADLEVMAGSILTAEQYGELYPAFEEMQKALDDLPVSEEPASAEEEQKEPEQPQTQEMPAPSQPAPTEQKTENPPVDENGEETRDDGVDGSSDQKPGEETTEPGGAIGSDKTTGSEIPTDPNQPSTSTDPTDPVEPEDPTNPTDPDNPGEPVYPVDPVEPVDPVDPVEPVDPVDPVDPTDPTDTVEPADPDQPAKPDEPVIDTDNPVDSGQQKPGNAGGVTDESHTAAVIKGQAQTPLKQVAVTVPSISFTHIDNSAYVARHYSEDLTTEKFISLVGESARTIAAENDLYASVMIAQAILESASGNSTLAQAPNNNLFGIKGTYHGNSVQLPTREDDGTGATYTIMSDFRQYETVDESLSDYADLLSNSMGDFYAGARKSNSDSFVDACDFLVGRYATDIFYSEKLQDLIETYDLTRFDVPLTYELADTFVLPVKDEVTGLDKYLDPVTDKVEYEALVAEYRDYVARTSEYQQALAEWSDQMAAAEELYHVPVYLEKPSMPAADTPMQQHQDAIDAERFEGFDTLIATGQPLPVREARTLNDLTACANSFLGVPYLWGGTTPAGFDCSGLVQYCYREVFNIELPRTTYYQCEVGVEVPFEELLPGDLLFFADGGDVHHVAMYLGDGYYVEAPHTGDVVKITAMNDKLPDFAKRVVDVRAIDMSEFSDEQLAQFVEREKYLQEREQRLGVTDETLAELTEWLRGLEF
ncbi:NlpC/P60 family protein [Adlercreutzia equolifaciens]|uniref:NlpC/P60 family protein n=1 Tax=Adlercreutzia equolifaciens TaxID=446660 RepID=UPI0026705C41|nr:NlpC/P60 family protein [Adlercreutzia equolifaciens]